MVKKIHKLSLKTVCWKFILRHPWITTLSAQTKGASVTFLLQELKDWWGPELHLLRRLLWCEETLLFVVMNCWRSQMRCWSCSFEVIRTETPTLRGRSIQRRLPVLLFWHSAGFVINLDWPLRSRPHHLHPTAPLWKKKHWRLVWFVHLWLPWTLNSSEISEKVQPEP